jgi:hypothetical protein
MPLHELAKTEKHLGLDIAPDKNKDTYFSSPLHPEYLYPNNISFQKENLEQHLASLWRDQPDLLKTIPDLLNLAFELKEEHQEQSADLSPFVYVMF